jgi:predicted acyltransferase
MTTEALPITDPQLLEPTPPAPLKRNRLLSLDVFRGITLAGMLLVNDPGPGQSYRPLDHIDAGNGFWGWTPTDLVFPFFLFIVGVAIPFAMAKRLSDPNV